MLVYVVLRTDLDCPYPRVFSTEEKAEAFIAKWEKLILGATYDWDRAEVDECDE